MNLDDQIKSATERGKRLLGPDAVEKAVAAEREACAALCERAAEEWKLGDTAERWAVNGALWLAERIRARGENPT